MPKNLSHPHTTDSPEILKQSPLNYNLSDQRKKPAVSPLCSHLQGAVGDPEGEEQVPPWAKQWEREPQGLLEQLLCEGKKSNVRIVSWWQLSYRARGDEGHRRTCGVLACSGAAFPGWLHIHMVCKNS